MKCNKKNCCNGYYGVNLDVKITNYCNGKCDFCIEKGGLSPCTAPVEDMIKSTIDFVEGQRGKGSADLLCRSILILGGEPLMYPRLEDYLKGIREYNKDIAIYLTTNGSMLDKEMAEMLTKYLTAINISIHHYDAKKNNAVYKTCKVSFSKLKSAISVFNKKKVPVRINCNLVRGMIETIEDANEMIFFAKYLGANELKFNELQGAEAVFVDSRDIWNKLTINPFVDGCETDLSIYKSKNFRVFVKQTCEFVNKMKPKVVTKPEFRGNVKHYTYVLYPDAKVRNGWVEQYLEDVRQEGKINTVNRLKKERLAKKKKEECSYDDSWISCHERRYNDEIDRLAKEAGIASFGCHAKLPVSRGCH